MNVKDKHFNPLVDPFIGKTIVLADYGFRDKDGVPENMKICKKGTWNERMCVETALSLVTVICRLEANSTSASSVHSNASGFCFRNVQHAHGFVSLASS